LVVVQPAAAAGLQAQQPRIRKLACTQVRALVLEFEQIPPRLIMHVKEPLSLAKVLMVDGLSVVAMVVTYRHLLFQAVVTALMESFQ
jgi:hypothetical protein